MSAIIIDGRIVHYETLGRGRPLIFIHGWIGSWRYWVPTMEELAPFFRTYAFDLWGFGDSDKSLGYYRVSDYVKLLDSFMNAMGIGRAPLVGHSLGAVVAVKFAAAHPHRVDKLVAVSLPLTARAVSEIALRKGNNLLGRLSPEYRELILEVKKASEKALVSSVRSVEKEDVWSDLLQVEAPVLIIYGEKDTVIDTRPLNALRDCEAQMRAISFPEASYFPMLEESGRFNRLLKEFLALGIELDRLRVKEEWRRKTG